MRLPILSSRPLQASIGAYIIVPAIPGKRCAPYSLYVQYQENDHLPMCSPTGAPWVLWQGDKTAANSVIPFWDYKGGTTNSLAHGLDADSRWWAYFPESFSRAILGGKFTDNGESVSAALEDVLRKGEPSSGGFAGPPKTGSWSIWTESTGGGFAGAIFGALNEIVLPAMAVAITVLVPGVGGIAGAAAFTALSQISQGIAVKQALITATRNSMPSLVEAAEFDKAIKLGQEQVPSSVMQAAKKALLTPQQRTSFDTGLIMVDAKKSQDQAVADLKRAFPSAAGKINYAFEQGAKVIDLANVYGGDKGIQIMNKAVKDAPKYSTGTAGGSKGSGGIGVGTIAVLGTVGYLGAKFGPTIYHSLMNKKPKLRK